MNVGWEMGTTGNSCVLLMPMRHQHWGAGNGLEDGLPHFKSSEVLYEPHRAFLGPPRLAQSCFAMLKSGSACWNLCWRPRRRGPDERRHPPGGQQTGFSQLVAPAKAASRGVWGILGYQDPWGLWELGRWGEAGAHDHRSAGMEAAPLPIWAVLPVPLQPELLAGSAHGVRWVCCCCWPRSWERADRHAPSVPACSSSPAWEIARVVRDPEGKEFVSKENRD